MTSTIESDGKTVFVTTDEGRRIGFALAELRATSTSGQITTDWAGGVPPASVEVAVRRANAEAERFVEQHQASKPAEAFAANQDGEGHRRTLEDMLGLP